MLFSCNLLNLSFHENGTFLVQAQRNGGGSGHRECSDLNELVACHYKEERPHAKPLHGIVEVGVLISPEQQIVTLVFHGKRQVTTNASLAM